MSEQGIKCGKCKGYHASVAAVRDCYRATRPAQAAPKAAPATEGMYVLDGTIYKVLVAVHGSGRLYAQRLVGTSFHAERGAISKLTQAHRMTPEAAAKFGHLYGRCVRCQATLTDDDSIKAGMGPVCRTKI
jgi:hypothetical protein